MKAKHSILLIFVIFLFFILGCSPGLERCGLVGYHKALCSYGLTSKLFPSDDYVNKFPYIDGGFHYLDDGIFETWGFADAIAWFQYDTAE